jgi:predicted AAA+ superfamily ATPase
LKEVEWSFGVADTTVRNYLDLMTSALVIRQLSPWHENISKRQVKAPKIYIADSGVLRALLGLRTLKDLEGHPKAGASWEGFVLEQVIHQLAARVDECFFWATHGGPSWIFLTGVTEERELSHFFRKNPGMRTACSHKEWAFLFLRPTPCASRFTTYD